METNTLEAPASASLRLGSTAPDFEDETSMGRISFHEDVIIAGSVSDEAAKERWPEGWKAPHPYIRIVPQLNGG